MRRPQRVAECGSPPKFHIEQPLVGDAQKILRLRRVLLASSSEKPIHLSQSAVPNPQQRTLPCYLMASTGSLRYEG
jgi:hypothetical protein